MDVTEEEEEVVVLVLVLVLVLVAEEEDLMEVLGILKKSALLVLMKVIVKR
jgi:hypothetical protein